MDKKPIIMYRDNTMFESYMPIASKVLNKNGIGYDLKVFPVGTPKDKIKTFMAENKDLFVDNLAITDGTCNIPFRLGRELNANSVDLDRIVKEETEKTIFGGKTSSEVTAQGKKGDYTNANQVKEYIDSSVNTYAKILSKVEPEKLSDMEIAILTGTPEFYVTLVDHEFLGSEQRKEEAKIDVLENAKMYANKMKQAFEKLGVKNVKIYDSAANLPEEFVDTQSEKSKYIIVNRHAPAMIEESYWGELTDAMEERKSSFGEPEEMKDPLGAVKLLQTPIETFYKDVCEKFEMKYPNSSKVAKNIGTELTKIIQSYKK